jgi:hypothetical protein
MKINYNNEIYIYIYNTYKFKYWSWTKIDVYAISSSNMIKMFYISNYWYINNFHV